MHAYHDLGGLPAGPLDLSEHTYAPWEERQAAMLVLLAEPRCGVMTVDELRRGIESLGAAEYDRLTYYEDAGSPRWPTSSCKKAFSPSTSWGESWPRSRRARASVMSVRFAAGERVHVRWATCGRRFMRAANAASSSAAWATSPTRKNWPMAAGACRSSRCTASASCSAPTSGPAAGLVQEPELPLTGGCASRALVLAEFGTTLPEDMTLRCASTTVRPRSSPYLVLPMRPAGTMGMSEQELATLAQLRDSMIGVASARPARLIEHVCTFVLHPDSVRLYKASRQFPDLSRARYFHARNHNL